jgi:hypothetical protein
MTRKELASVFIVSFLSLIAFGAYLLLIGIPRTQARNLYNEAYTLSDQGKQTEAKLKLEEAYRVWPEPYILDGIQRLDAN